MRISGHCTGRAVRLPHLAHDARSSTAKAPAHPPSRSGAGAWAERSRWSRFSRATSTESGSTCRCGRSRRGRRQRARLREAGVPVEGAPQGSGRPPGSFLRSLRARVRETRPDVIHAHNTPAARWAATGVGRCRAQARPGADRAHVQSPKARRARVLSRDPGGAVRGRRRRRRAGHRAPPAMRSLWRTRYVTIPNGIETEEGATTPIPIARVGGRSDSIPHAVSS